MLNSKEYTIKVKYLQQENSKFGLFLENITGISTEEYPGPNPPFEVWRSMQFFVQLFDEKNGIVRITVCRTMIDRNGDWLDGISWDDLQSIKRIVGLGDFFAVEVYPEDKEIHNDANMRHLWVLPERLPFAWKHATPKSRSDGY